MLKLIKLIKPPSKLDDSIQIEKLIVLGLISVLIALIPIVL